MSWDDEVVELSELIGKTLNSVYNDTEKDEIVFVTADGVEYKMYHDQDCCESVYVESVVGDLRDLVGTPILMAEEVTNYEAPALGEYDESFTWTFYKFATIKGYVDIRWYGTSNGYYSESVRFVRVR